MGWIQCFEDHGLNSPSQEQGRSHCTEMVHLQTLLGWRSLSKLPYSE